MSKISNELVSVVIPTFERPKLLREALESVLAQTHSNLEIFITDNSHNTETKDLIQQYRNRDSRIIYEHHPEYTVAKQNFRRAQTYNNPKAKYVNWLMDDDLFMPTKIEDMLLAFEAYPNVSLVTSTRRSIDMSGRYYEDINFFNYDKDVVIKGSAAGRAILSNISNWIGEPTTALIKKECMIDNRLGWHPTVNAKYNIVDFTTWLSCLEHGDLYYMVEPKSYYRVHDGQQQHNPRIMASAAICWGVCMEYAWKNKIYLIEPVDFLLGAEFWYKLFTRAIKKIETSNLNDEMLFSDLLNIYDRIENIRRIIRRE